MKNGKSVVFAESQLSFPPSLLTTLSEDILFVTVKPYLPGAQWPLPGRTLEPFLNSAVRARSEENIPCTASDTLMPDPPVTPVSSWATFWDSWTCVAVITLGHGLLWTLMLLYITNDGAGAQYPPEDLHSEPGEREGPVRGPKRHRNCPQNVYPHQCRISQVQAMPGSGHPKAE